MDETKQTTLWCVCPVYQDTTAFQLLRKEIYSNIRHKLEALGISFIKFLVIDDTAGADPDFSVIEELEDTFSLIPPHSLGHQRALVYGLRKFSSHFDSNDIIVTLDSDGEDRPCDIPEVLATLLEKEKTSGMPCLVLAKRTKRKTTLKFKLLYAGFKVLFYVLTGKTISTGNFACMRARVMKRLIQHPHFDISYSSTLLAMKISREFVLCPRGSRFAGSSRMSAFALMIHGFRMLMPFIDLIAVRLLIVCAALLLAAGALSIYILIRHFLLGFDVHFSLLVILAIISVISVSVFGNFLVLFTVLSRSDGITLKNIEYSAKSCTGSSNE